jgi:hypothetical protein
MKDLFLHYCQRAKPSKGTVFVKFLKIRHMTSHCSICNKFFEHLKTILTRHFCYFSVCLNFSLLDFLKHLNEVKRASAFSLLFNIVHIPFHIFTKFTQYDKKSEQIRNMYVIRIHINHLS